MGMLDRYRKTGGFLNLLILLETSAQGKQDKFLSLIAEESQRWADEIKAKIITFEKLVDWETSVLMEFLPNMPERILASAVWSLPPEKKELVLKALPLVTRRRVEEQFAGNAPTPNEIISCQLRLVTEARQSAQKGAIRFDKFAPELAINEDIEEILSKSDKSEAASHKWDPESTSASIKLSSDSHTSGGNVANLDEVRELKRKLMTLSKDFEQLEKEYTQVKHKLEQIKKII